MATSWAKETDANIYYSKLCRLLYDGGTLAVKTVFDGIVTPASLAATLSTNQYKLLKLKKPTGRVLSQDQWNLLYPPSGACPKSEDFDITLLFVLLRNICGLTPPPTGWDALPPSTGTSLQANLARIKYYRNKVTAHSSNAKVDETLFETYWSDITRSLVSLGLKQDEIDELKSSPLGAKDYNELVEYWYLSDEDVKHQLEAMKSKLEEIESKMPNTSGENELCKLQYVNYTSLIDKKCELYHPSTRQWIFDKVEENVKMSTTESSVVLIRAGPGMGKSIVAAKLCEIYKNNGLLGGCHFFQYSNSLRNNPRYMLQSIARQLCSCVDGYQAALETKLKTLQGKIISDLNCEELFGVLFEEPLSQINIDHNVVIVIDAVDECTSQFKQEFEDTLKRKTCELSSWVRFIITTRPLPSCKDLHRATPIDIDPSDPRNERDLAFFYGDKLTERNVHLADHLKKITKGIFLVAYFVLDMLDQGGKSLTEVRTFPVRGLSSVYEYYFTRIRNLIKPYIDDGGFFLMLEAVVASEIPIPKDMFYEILGLKGSDKVSRDQRKERNDAVHMLHTIFPVENDHVTIFHKSVTDWLTLDDNENPQFSVSVDRGVEVLAEKCLDSLRAFKERTKPLDQPLVLSDREEFAILGIEYVFESSSIISETEKTAILGDVTVIAAVLGVIRSREEERFSLLNNRFFGYVKDVALHVISRVLFRDEKLRFGHYLSLVGDLMLHHNRDSHLSPSDKEKLQHWLVDNKVPHYTRQFLSHLPFSSHLFEVANGFIAFSTDFKEDGINVISVLTIDNNYYFGKQKTLQCSPVGVIGVSPDKKYLILTASRDRNKLELYDVKTLKKKKQYNCPTHDHERYHIFGNDKEWYILFITNGAEINIVNGQNGKLHSSFTLDRNETIRAVSQSGHILIANILQINDEDEDDDDDHCFGLSFYTIHFMKPDEKVYYYRHSIFGGWVCLSLENPFVGYSFKFSHDGKYVAMCSYHLVSVFHTNDGSLFRKYDSDLATDINVVLFLSSSCLVMQWCGIDYISDIFFYDLTLDRLIYITPIILANNFHTLNGSPLVVQPPRATDTFPPAIYGLTKDNNFVKLEFHNLEQKFLNSA